MIKPEDVSVESISESMQFSAAAFLDHALKEPKVRAALVRELIAGGHCSPSVWTVRDNSGNLLDDDVYGLYSSPDAAESKHGDGYIAEHWKGQTE
jgi:hypothetical protein